MDVFVFLGWATVSDSTGCLVLSQFQFLCLYFGICYLYWILQKMWCLKQGVKNYFNITILSDQSSSPTQWKSLIFIWLNNFTASIEALVGTSKVFLSSTSSFALRIVSVQTLLREMLVSLKLDYDKNNVQCLQLSEKKKAKQLYIF